MCHHARVTPDLLRRITLRIRDDRTARLSDVGFDIGSGVAWG